MGLTMLSMLRSRWLPTGFGVASGSSPHIRFAFRPVNFDVGTKKVTLDLDGVEAVFDPPGDGPPLEESGTWALFRLLRHAQVQPTGSERVLRVTFEQGERRAVLDLSTEGLRNPFRPSLLDHFSCPSLQQ